MKEEEAAGERRGGFCYVYSLFSFPTELTLNWVFSNKHTDMAQKNRKKTSS